MLNKEYTLNVPVSEKDHIQGSPKASITLVEYGDYQCPYCGEAYPIVKQLQKHFGKDLRFVFRNFPLTQIHQYAFSAAEAAEIADEYGKFWEMHDKLFENQDALDIANLVDYAKELGIDSLEFSKKLIAKEKSERVQSDFMSGVESNVNGTPCFFVNNIKYEGNWDYETFKLVLSQLT